MFFILLDFFELNLCFRPYSLAGGMPSNVWFDRFELGIDKGTKAEEKESVNFMAFQLGSLIEEEIKSGIPLNRILIGKLHIYQFFSFFFGFIISS